MYAVYYTTRAVMDWMRGDFDKGQQVSREFLAWAVRGGARSEFFRQWASVHSMRFYVLKGDVGATRELMPTLQAFFQARFRPSFFFGRPPRPAFFGAALSLSRWRPPTYIALPPSFIRCGFCRLLCH